MRRWGLVSAGAVALALVVAGCDRTADGGGVSLDRLLNAASEPQNWLTHGGTYLEQRFSPLDQVNAAN
ncbi:MAG: hypothetical protein INF91_09725, partial [Alphaproteobacteria bacterium]|nr:hypothetical protein [Alphaproteobacteria bacterium]